MVANPIQTLAVATDKPNVIASVNSAHVKDRAMRALGRLPAFSPILNRLLASLARDNVSFAELAALIEKDAVLAGHLLRLVNSAAYGLRGTVSSIRQAVCVLGIAKLRNAILSVSVARMWSQVKAPQDWSMARFNLHSASVAILADLLAQRLPVKYGEGAFTAGLFHDLGLALVALGVPEGYAEIARLLQEGQNALDSEPQVLGLSHADLSAEALTVWNLPEPIQTAVRYHDTPFLDPTAVEPGKISLSRVLNAADRFVVALGTSLYDGMPEDGPSALESLGLGEQLPTLRNEFENQLAAIKPYFEG